MYFMHELIAALKNYALRLDCPEMELIQEGTTTPIVIKGPGDIRQEPDGTLAFKVFSSQTATSHAIVEPDQDLILGQLLPSTKYYSLRATDNYKREWTAQRIRAEISSGHVEDGRQAVIGTGVLRDIEYLDKHAGEGSGQELRITFFENIEIPYNTGTVTEKHVAGKLVSREFCRNVALFRAAGFNCRVAMENGYTTFAIETDGQLPPRMEVRVIETFQFILARTVWPRVIRIFDSGTEIIRLTSALVATGKPQMNPPIQNGTMEEHIWTWELFHKYLTYVLNFTDDGWHPCSRHLYAVSKASANSVHLEALALGVAVEGICNEVFAHLCKPTPNFKSAVASLQNHAVAWPGPDRSQDSTLLRKRVSGLIGTLTKPRAIDRMHQLAAWGWIDKDLIAAWQELRNKSAHGSMPEARASQKFLDRCQQVTDLLYQLVFCAIGYEGKYIIRTPRAWRPREFPSPEFWTSREDAIQVNAYYRWLERGASHGNDLDDWLAAKRAILDAEWHCVSPNLQPRV